MQFVKEEFLTFVATLLLILLVFTRMETGLLLMMKTLIWIIFWINLFRAYRIDKNWAILFTLPVLFYNPIYSPAFTYEFESFINGLNLMLAISWILKRFRVFITKTE